MVVGAVLFQSRTRAAAGAELLIAVLVFIEGLGFITNFRGYADASIREYKREPASALAKSMPWWVLRFVYGGVFVWMAAMYVWVAVRTLA